MNQEIFNKLYELAVAAKDAHLKLQALAPQRDQAISQYQDALRAVSALKARANGFADNFLNITKLGNSGEHLNVAGHKAAIAKLENDAITYPKYKEDMEKYIANHRRSIETINDMLGYEQEQLNKSIAAGEKVANDLLQQSMPVVDASKSHQDTRQAFVDAFTEEFLKGRTGLTKEIVAEQIEKRFFAPDADVEKQLNKLFETNFTYDGGSFDDEQIQRIKALSTELETEASKAFLNSTKKQKLDKADALKELIKIATTQPKTAIADSIDQVIKKFPDCESGRHSRVRELFDDLKGEAKAAAKLEF